MYSSTLSLTSALDEFCGQRHAAAALPPRKAGYLVQEAGWASGQVWTGTENLAPHWVSNPEQSNG